MPRSCAWRDHPPGVVRPGRASRQTPLHGDIASRVSTTRETVSRALGDLSRQGILARDHDALVVTDPERLADMVEHFRSE